MAQYPTDEEVLNAVDNAGWLLEQQAGRTLENHGFATRPNWAFRDPEDPTASRELDVWSHREFYFNAEHRIRLAANMLVECKQSELPFCVIGQEIPEKRRFGNPAEHTLPVRYVPSSYDAEQQVLKYGYAWDVLGFRDLVLRHGHSNFRGSQLTRLDRKNSGWSATNSGVFNSLVFPLAKAIRADQKNAKARDEWPQAEHRRSRSSFVNFILRFPVVLISCPHHVVDASGDQATIRTAPWVRVQRHLDSEAVRGIFEFDVVTRGAFVQYIHTVVEGLASEMGSMFEHAPLTYTGEDCTPPGTPDRVSKTSHPPREWA